MTTSKQPIVWTISGADCSGGAGIAADLKTAQQLKVEMCHLITANTVQNAQQLVAVNPVSVDILQAQAQCLLHDKPPAVIKIGLLVTQAQVLWLTDFLASAKAYLPNLKVVYDPVGQASVGGKFASLTTADLLPLLKQVDVLTPNALEAQQLAANSGTNIAELAKEISALGVNTVIIKGGHSLSKEKATDCLDYCLHRLTANDSSKMSAAETIIYQLVSPLVKTSYSHGGGCSFASAMAAFLAYGYLVRDAFTLTKAFMQKGLTLNAGKTDYYGAFLQTPWPNQKQYFPKVKQDLVAENFVGFAELGLKRGGAEKLGLYPVIDSLYWLKRLLPLGLNIIQLRVKNKSTAELEAIVSEACELCKNSKTRLFINDYWQLAIKYGAYGVHIGQEDLIDADLPAIAKAGLRLGISTHGCYEFLLAQQLKPSYLAIGAIFPTKTKNMTGQIQGLDNLQQILSLANDISVVAIGGINLERAPKVLATGVDSIAVVTAITEAEQPELAVGELQKIIKSSAVL